MTVAAVLLADGFETVEALGVVDILRRAGIKTRTCSIMSTTQVVSAQQVQVVADTTLGDIDPAQITCVVVPGGLPGTQRLRNSAAVCDLLAQKLGDQDATVACICAAPSILGELGLLDGRKATVFPGCEGSFPEGVLQPEPVVVDGNLITARSMGYTVEFACAVVARIAGPLAARKVLQSIGDPRSCLPATL